MRKFHLQNREFNRHQLEEWVWHRLPHAPDWEKQHLLFMLEWLDKNDHIVVSTSGSTGVPKQIVLKKEWMRHSAKTTANYFGLPPESSALLALPSTFIAGKMMIVRALEMGWRLQWVAPLASPDISSAAGFDFAAFTPMQAAALLKKDRIHFESIQQVILGGGVVSPALEDELQKCTNRIVITYGMTETCSHVATREVHSKKKDSDFFALPGIAFSSDDRRCLVIHAPQLADTPVVTNDVIQLKSAFQFSFIGRNDHIINSGGVKIFPEELERQLATWIPAHYLITSETDEVLGERMILQIEGAPWSPEEIDKLKLMLKERLDHTRWIRDIRFIPQFEYTDSGKWIRKNYSDD